MIGRTTFGTLLVATCALLTGCSAVGGVTSHATPKTPQQPAVVYAAVGASESVGVGATDATRDSWPQVFFRTGLPESTVFYNFGIPGATVAVALSEELPEALSVKPSLVTVWLNVDDMIAGLSAQQYHDELDQLVHGLRQGGSARVLIANTPFLDRLPAYLTCHSGASAAGLTCPPQLVSVSPSQLNALVDAYNAAIADVVQHEGATLVDLHGQGEVADAHPDWVSTDGFHPSTKGYVAIAAEFAAALKQP